MTAPPPTPPKLGLVVPPAGDVVPPDGAMLYGSRAEFIARGLGLPEISSRGYDEVIDAVATRSATLANLGVDAISLMGTSLSFYRGAKFADQIVREMALQTGLPCTSMSHAIVRGLGEMGLRKVAVATAYIDDVNDRLIRFLAEHDIAAPAIEGLSITGVREVGEVTTQTLVELCERVWVKARGAEGILISCGGLLTLEASGIIEARLGVPVVSSSPAGFWDLMRVGGQVSVSSERGRLFER